VRLGAVFPQTELGPDAGSVHAFAQAAEAIGYSHLIAYDHVLGADPDGHPGLTGPFTYADQFHDTFVLFGFIAAAAPRLGLATSVISLPQRQTALVAKQAAELDLLTDGRFRLGIGTGWNPVEYEALGMPFRNRADRYEEQISLLRELWQHPIVSFYGDYHRVVSAGLNPLPRQRPIPIWIGGSSEPAMRRAARLADGFFPVRPLAGGWEHTLDQIRQWLAAAGRRPETFGLEPKIDLASGSEEYWRSEAELWVSRGATHISLNSLKCGCGGADEHIALIERAHEAVADLIPG
jgi:probable F420-dependent oxidoreductase